MYKLINCCCICHILLDHVIAPMRPVMWLENHLRIVSKKALCFCNISCPRIGITNLCTAERIEVMHGSCTVFCHPECFHIWKICIHFCRRFCIRCKLEYCFYTVDSCLKDFFCHVKRWLQICNTSLCYRKSDSYRKSALFSCRYHWSVLIYRSAFHCSSHKNILWHNRFLESLRYDNCSFSGCDLFFKRKCRICQFICSKYSLNSTIMIYMRVTDDHRRNMYISHLRFKQIQRCFCSCFTCHTVQNDPSAIASHKSHIGNIIASYLINIIWYLE